MYQYLLEPKAQEEYEKSINWYTQRSEKATLNFIDEVEQIIELICNKPHVNKNIYKNYYEITLEKYPFTIVYSIENEMKLIVITSIYHQKRNPKYKYRSKKTK